jgi:hypothetical protein
MPFLLHVITFIMFIDELATIWWSLLNYFDESMHAEDFEASFGGKLIRVVGAEIYLLIFMLNLLFTIFIVQLFHHVMLQEDCLL